MKSLKNIRLIAVMLSSLLMAACVTERTGGFNTEATEEDLIQDYLQLSLGYIGQNDFVNARRHLNNAMKLDSNNSSVHGVWGLLYSEEGDTELADERFRRALRIDSRNSQVRNNYAAFLFSNGFYEEAYEQLEQVVADTEYTQRAQSFENMGLAAIQLNNLQGAEYAFSRALQLNSNQLQSNLELADIYLQKGNRLEAKAYYSAYLTLARFFNVEQTSRSLSIGEQTQASPGETRGSNE